MTHRRVGRWRVGLVGTLALTGFGLLFASRALLVAAAIPLTYVLFGTVSSVAAAPALAASRSFDPPDPRPGEAVTVTVTVENAGESVLTDVRVVDGVPAELAVTDGSPRAGVALGPGDTATLTYDVVAKRGRYEFDDPVVRLRSLAGTEQLTEVVAADGETTLSCANAIREVPLHEAALPRAGTLPTDSGGNGLEFYATRQYRPGDPMNRVDWRHYAKTGEFVTVQYRREQSVRTVVVVDARAVGRVTPMPGYPTAAELCAYAGERLHDALSAAGVATAVTAVGVDDGRLEGLVGPDGLPWIDSASREHAGLAGRLFEELQGAAVALEGAERPADPLERRRSPTVGETAADGGRDQQAARDDSRETDERVQRLLARLPPNAQVVVCTPLVDDWPVGLARALSVRDYPQVVVSPDATGGETVGQRLLGVDRRRRLRELERTGATTVGWELEQPIDYALRRSLPHLLR